MHNYEIRVVRDDGSAALITAEICLSDEAAIRCGQKISQGHSFEVWRGLERVFNGRAPANSNNYATKGPSA